MPTHNEIMQIDLTVVMVSYNTAPLLKECMTALRQSLAGCSHEIVIIDNASIDDSVTLIRREFPDCRLIENKVNVGFGRANNQALPWVRGRYMLLLNTDAFVSPDTLNKTIAFMDAYSQCGILGVKLIGRDGLLQPSARYFPTLLNSFIGRTGLKKIFRSVRMVDDMAWDHKSVKKCDWVPGCYYLIRKDVIDQVGLFDPRYFLYYEEVDHCYAAKKAGWEVIFFPHTEVIHIGGESAKSAGQITKGGRQLEAVQIESELLYFRKNHSAFAVMADVLLILLANAINISRHLLMGRPWKAIPADWRNSALVLSKFWQTRWGTQPTR